MYLYLQESPEGQGTWQLFDEKALATADVRPAFTSVLLLDADPDGIEAQGLDPLEHVKYLGPMYFDLDNASDIDAVLESSRELLRKIEALNIDLKYVSVWLSGSKGVHITIPESLFGITRATKFLPYIYREIATQLHVPDLDMAVYSAGKGRLWRTPNVKRPTGTYKVPVSVDELMGLDAEGYAQLVQEVRLGFEVLRPPKQLVANRAKLLFDSAKQLARKRAKALAEARTIPAEELRKLPAVPGCIEKLITEGDCEASNYNQAALQVAAWIAARYEREEEAQYKAEILEPFLANVTSASRSTDKERRRHVSELLKRAWTGRVKFAVGPLIATLGGGCGHCPICRGDLDFDQASAATEDDEFFHEATRIKLARSGHQLITENSPRQLTSFIFRPRILRNQLSENSQGRLSETERTSMVGDLIEDSGIVHEQFEMPEEAWGSKAAMIRAVRGRGSCSVYCSDQEIQKIYTATMALAMAEGSGVEDMTVTTVCGMIFERRKKTIIPHYVEADDSLSTAGYSKYRYVGPYKLSPRLIEEDYPYEEDVELEKALDALFRINDLDKLAPLIGWVCACPFRQHIHEYKHEFPLLNVWGNASAGKTATASVVTLLGGMDYILNEPLNVENASLRPLIDYVTSSTTVPRLIEEVNETPMGRQAYRKAMAIFKAAWNSGTASRGRLGRQGSGHNVEIDENRISSPILFISEQRVSLPSLRNRTVEVMLTAAGREAPGREDAYMYALRHRRELLRAAKALVWKALNTHPDEIVARLEAGYPDYIPRHMDTRPQMGLKCVYLGLDMLEETLDHFGIDVHERVQAMREALARSIQGDLATFEADKRTSEVDKVLKLLNQLAADPEDRQMGLVAGKHYWRTRSELTLDLSTALSRYLRHCRSTGIDTPINNLDNLRPLLHGESYFVRQEAHPERPDARLEVLDLAKLRAKAIDVSHFLASDP